MAESTKLCIPSDKLPNSRSVSVNSKGPHNLRNVGTVKYYEKKEYCTQKKFGKKNSNMKKKTKKQKCKKCKRCNETFKSVNLLNIHNRSKHMNMKYTCPHCLKEYIRQPFFERHVNLHCKKCFVLQPNNTKLLLHMSTCRPSGIDNQIVETTNYTCDICTDQFPTHCQLACHIACVHTEGSARIDTLYHELIIGASVVYVCYFCKLSSPDKNYLESHVTDIRVMIETYVKYTCCYCSETFSTEFDLIQHKLLHEEKSEMSSTETNDFPISAPIITNTNVETPSTDNFITVEVENINNYIPETGENMGDSYGITKDEVDIEEVLSKTDQQVNTHVVAHVVATTSSAENNEAETQSAVQNSNLNQIILNQLTNAIAIRGDTTMRIHCETGLPDLSNEEYDEKESTKIEISSDESDDDKDCLIIDNPTPSTPSTRQRPVRSTEQRDVRPVRSTEQRDVRPVRSTEQRGVRPVRSTEQRGVRPVRSTERRVVRPVRSTRQRGVRTLRSTEQRDVDGNLLFSINVFQIPVVN